MRRRFFTVLLCLALPGLAFASEDEAIEAVKQFPVPTLEAVQAHVDAWRAEVEANPEAAPSAPAPPAEPLPTVTLGELTERGELATLLGVQGLAPGEWKARAARGSTWIVKQTYTRNNATIAPCWHVDLSTGAVEPHNDLARIFHPDPVDPESVAFSQELMANRVRVAASHANAYGLPLGAAALGVFAYRDERAEDDAIFGWLIDHGGDDTYDAMFQWRAGGTRDNARWEVDRVADLGPRTPAKFMRASRGIRPDNPSAHRLMEKISTFGVRDEQFVIAPEGFADVPMLPRAERLSGALAATCKERKQREGCDAWLRVLEDEAIMAATRALVAGQLSASYCSEDELKRDWHCGASVNAHKRCVSDGLCRWERSKASGGIYTISYLYESADAELGVTFGVDPESGAIQPLDVPAAWILQAIAHDVAPDATLVAPQRQVTFFSPEDVQAHTAMVSERHAFNLADAELESTDVDLGGGGGGGGPLSDEEIQDPIYSSPTIDDISRCLEAEYARTGGAVPVKIDVSFSIAPSGDIKRFRTNAPDISTDRCLNEAITPIRYRTFKGVPRKVSFPFEFS